MAAIRTSLLPRRLTQMYTDTKRSYEQVVQTNTTNPQLSSLHLKLRIQKDRLIAWGLEWADRKVGQSDDIDSSLDRAGISDLVASIMSSIRKLLDEAERIQPQSRTQLTGSYPVDKHFSANHGTQWTPGNLARLEDIVRDITTSIDTLCDLSRSQQLAHQNFNPQMQKTSLSESAEKIPRGPPSSLPRNINYDGRDVLQGRSSLISSSRIDSQDLFFPLRPQVPAATPPSYNSTATDPGNRVFAFFRFSDASRKASGLYGQMHDTPVLVDYYSEDDSSSGHGTLPSLQRYEDLVLSLQEFPRRCEYGYTGSLKLLGWLSDPLNFRYAFVYEIPGTPLTEHISSPRDDCPSSLLSYLQNSGDIDSTNVPCLEDRFRLALNLVSTLLHIHAKGLTHRNINSNNVIFVNGHALRGSENKPWKEGIIRKPYFVSWDQCTKDTPNSEPETLISNIYRHPAVERGQRSRYQPAHDIYSLGLVLLEIGLWMPLNKLWKTKYTRSHFKARLQSVYSTRLAAKCGSAYMNAVQKCLGAVDASLSASASPRDQQVKMQNDYYWGVLKPLERSCIMDESDEPRILTATSAPVVHPDVSSGIESSSHENDRRHTEVVPSRSPTEIQPSQSREAAQFSRELPSEQPEWGTEKGYSPLHPGGIDLPVWTYGADKDAWEYYSTVMKRKIAFLAYKAIDRNESWEVSVFMAGSTRESARPTILFVCKQKSFPVAWKILNYVNADKKIFDLFLSAGQLSWSKGKKKRVKSAGKIAKEPDQAGEKPCRYQQKPQCGASIGCFVDEQHSEAVTFGGVVLVDGQPYGMSVHHMLEDSDSVKSVADVEEDDGNESWDFRNQSDGSPYHNPGFDVWNLPEGFDSPDPLPDGIDALENLPEGFDALQILEAEEQSKGTLPESDLLVYKPEHGEHPAVTQPAIDDIDSTYFVDKDNMSDDHLQLHGLGTVYASSGLRQLQHEKSSHELDWALFTLHNDRKPAINIVEGCHLHCEKAGNDSYPSRLLKADALSGLEVHAYGATSGLKSGRIIEVMELTYMPGRGLPSDVWRFTGKFGVGGDSGAWIIDNNTGGLCGHVSAWSESRQRGVLVPTEAQLYDMEQSLGVDVSLPTGNKASFRSFKEQIINQSPKLRGGFADPSADFGCNSDGESDVSSVADQPYSPDLATSPPVSAPTASKPDTLSLNHVAEKWESTQANKRNQSLERSARDGSIGGKVPFKEGVKAKC